MPANTRVDDAIKAAGGLSPDADSTRINLAAKVSDGQKLYIQRVGESVSQSVSGSVGQVAGESVSQININTASESELDKLPGIGPVTAQKIIASRPYSSPEELLSKKVVSSSVYEKIKDLISL
ncbi:MAG: ComEA family DNA-binding protein [Candidatus Curtissbacteria bacterium]|nr:ComEA family DNA-binding protein [Candidatus Curtissbacteria bacterium]